MGTFVGRDSDKPAPAPVKSEKALKLPDLPHELLDAEDCRLERIVDILMHKNSIAPVFQAGDWLEDVIILKPASQPPPRISKNMQEMRMVVTAATLYADMIHTKYDAFALYFLIYEALSSIRPLFDDPTTQRFEQFEGNSYYMLLYVYVKWELTHEKIINSM